MAVAFQKKTLRRMSPTTRKVARLTGEALSVAKRFKNLVPDIQRLELDSQALATAKQQGIVLTDSERQTLYHLINDRLLYGQQFVIGTEERLLLLHINRQL